MFSLRAGNRQDRGSHGEDLGAVSGLRPWAGHVLTLPHPACPHPGSGWTSGRLREKRGGFISGVLGGFSVSELQVRTFAEKEVFKMRFPAATENLALWSPRESAGNHNSEETSDRWMSAFPPSAVGDVGEEAEGRPPECRR